jgi:hypothetical protein
VTPEVLQIHRERLKPGAEAAYAANETRITERLSELGCPHPYLGVESLSGPLEAWYFNGYVSESEITAVADAYARNVALMAALGELGARKAALIVEPVSAFARYRPGWTVGIPWALGQGRFLAISVSAEGGRVRGTVFEEAGGTRYAVEAFRIREEAEAAAAGRTARVFAVRPEWSYPAKEWVSADPEFWRGHPGTRRLK